MTGVQTCALPIWIAGTLRLKPVKPTPQDAGSAITYARRYALAAIVGVVTEDDDGNAASQPNGHAPPAQRPTPAKPEPSPLKARVREAVKKWTGAQPLDLPAAIKECKALAGLPAVELDEKQLTALAGYLDGAMGAGEKFAEAVAKMRGAKK